MIARSWTVLLGGDEQVLAIAATEDECWKSFHAIMRGSLEDASQAGTFAAFREYWEPMTYFTKVQEVQELGA